MRHAEKQKKAVATKTHDIRPRFSIGFVHECHCGALHENLPKLKSHQRKNHSQRKLSCEICNKTFNHNKLKTRHWNKLHSSSLGSCIQPSLSVHLRHLWQHLRK